MARRRVCIEDAEGTAPALNVSEDGWVREYVSRVAGADAFRVRLLAQGELVMVLMRRRGACTYAGDYSLRTGSPVAAGDAGVAAAAAAAMAPQRLRVLELLHLHRDGDALNERLKGWAPLLAMSIVEPGTTLRAPRCLPAGANSKTVPVVGANDVGGGRRKLLRSLRRQRRRAAAAQATATVAGADSRPSAATEAGAQLPACEGGSVAGRWARMPDDVSAGAAAAAATAVASAAAAAAAATGSGRLHPFWESGCVYRCPLAPKCGGGEQARFWAAISSYSAEAQRNASSAAAFAQPPGLRLAWRPFGCRYDELTDAKPAAAVAQCLTGGSKRVLFLGDSQMRPVETSFLRAMPGGYSCTKPDKTKYAMRTCRARPWGADGALLETFYLWNPFGRLQVFNKTGIAVRGGDTIVINFGQHPASGQHWTVARYAATLKLTLADMADVTRAVVGRGGTPPRLVWSTSAAFPLRCEGPVVQKRDWRTEPRLLLFNALATEAMESHGVRVFDYHALTWPLSHAAQDHSHYFSDPFLGVAGKLLVSTICAAELREARADDQNDPASRPNSLDSSPSIAAASMRTQQMTVALERGGLATSWLAGYQLAYGSGALDLLGRPAKGEPS